jgi:putative transposase
MSKKVNQNFISIPYNSFLHKLTYKLNKIGIEVILNEELYTSKCSFFDNEEIKKHNVYKGKRVKRGLFKTEQRLLINADVNGSLNIFKKIIKNLSNEVQNALLKPLDIGFVVNPFKITNFNELVMLINMKCLI